MQLDETITLLKHCKLDKRNHILSALRHSFNGHKPGRLMMNWQEAGHMNDSGLIRFGSHTVNHVMLDQIPIEHAEWEIHTSLQDIQAHLGYRTNLFAYPNGNFTSDLRNLIREYNFLGAGYYTPRLY